MERDLRLGIREGDDCTEDLEETENRRRRREEITFREAMRERERGERKQISISIEKQRGERAVKFVKRKRWTWEEWGVMRKKH